MISISLTPPSYSACATFLHQVQGSLRMLELYAPAMVGEEMETLATTLAEGEARNRDEASAALMRGVVLLPDYLERLQGGHRDIPIVLLPLLNELRAARGAPGLSESVLFAPDLHRPLPATASGVASDDAAQGQLARFSDALAQWPESGAPADASALAAAAEGLVGHARDESAQRMLWVAASMAHALQAGAVQPGAARVDVGPRLTLRLPQVGEGGRIALDWRQRVAGDAHPESGLALTLAADF